jgi:hypothetical protein
MAPPKQTYKITKKEICAILLAYYGKDESKSSKPVLVQMLSEKIQETPENIVVSHADVAAAAF